VFDERALTAFARVAEQPSSRELVHVVRDPLPGLAQPARHSRGRVGDSQGIEYPQARRVRDSRQLFDGLDDGIPNGHVVTIRQASLSCQGWLSLNHRLSSC
jgi:hypothetical protein